MIYRFPALLNDDENEPGFVVISFPDLLGIGSECAYGEEEETAKEVLTLALVSMPHYRLMNPTDIKFLKERYPNSRVIIVEVEISDDDSGGLSR